MKLLKNKKVIIIASVIIGITILDALLSFVRSNISGGYNEPKYYGIFLCKYIEYPQGYYGEDGTEKGWELRILGIRVAGNADKSNFKEPHTINLPSRNNIVELEIKNDKSNKSVVVNDNEAINTIYNILKKLNTQKMATWDYLFASEERYDITLVGENIELYIFKGYKNKKGNIAFDHEAGVKEAYYVMKSDFSHALYEITEEEFNTIKKYSESNVSTQLVENVDYIIDKEYPVDNFDLLKRGYYIDSLDEPNAPYYYIICMGTKSSSGYDIKVKEINKKNNLTEIIVEEISPEGIALVMPAFTYPKVVVKFPEYQENISIKNTKGEEYTNLEYFTSDDEEINSLMAQKRAYLFITSVENIRDAANNKYAADMLTAISRNEKCYTVAQLAEWSYIYISEKNIYGAVCVYEDMEGPAHYKIFVVDAKNGFMYNTGLNGNVKSDGSGKNNQNYITTGATLDTNLDKHVFDISILYDKTSASIFTAEGIKNPSDTTTEWTSEGLPCLGATTATGDNSVSACFKSGQTFSKHMFE